MRTFEDAKGLKWTIDLGVGTIRRVKALLDVDLTLPQSADPNHGTLSQRLVTDIWLLVDVLCAVCRPQAEKEGVSDEEFAERLGGEVLGKARAALLEEWSDFFRSLGRADLAAAVTKTLKMLTAVADEAVTQMDKLETVILDKAKAAMETGATQALETALQTMSSASGG